MLSRLRVFEVYIYILVILRLGTWKEKRALKRAPLFWLWVRAGARSFFYLGAGARAFCEIEERANALVIWHRGKGGLIENMPAWARQQLPHSRGEKKTWTFTISKGFRNSHASSTCFVRSKARFGSVAKIVQIQVFSFSLSSIIWPAYLEKRL